MVFVSLGACFESAALGSEAEPMVTSVQVHANMGGQMMSALLLPPNAGASDKSCRLLFFVGKRPA